MVYTPEKIITVKDNTLTESSDLTVTLSSLEGKNSFLLVIKNNQKFTLDIDRICLYTTGLNKTLPMSSVFSTVMTDLFVETYSDISIPTKMDSGYYAKRLRVYNPISYKDITVDFTSTNTPTIINDPYQKGFLDDLVIASPTIDLTECLVAVNGVFHKTAIYDNKLYVIDGFRTCRLTDRKDVTIVDTSSIGGHTTIPLTSSNVVQTTYNDWATITLDTDISNKTLALVVDGYLYHIDSGVLSVIDSHHVKIKTNLIQFISQFRHNPRTMYQIDRYGEQANQSSRRYTDTYSTMFLNNRSIASSVLNTRDFQYSRLTHYHSFLVVFNSPRLYTVNTRVSTTGTPRFYYDYSNNPLSGILSYGAGLCPSYLIHNESGGRKKILISGQDNDIDYQSSSYNPLFIPSLIETPELATEIPARFIDYIKE
jgi:hypothetical protein